MDLAHSWGFSLTNTKVRCGLSAILALLDYKQSGWVHVADFHVKAILVSCPNIAWKENETQKWSF